MEEVRSEHVDGLVALGMNDGFIGYAVRELLYLCGPFRNKCTVKYDILVSCFMREDTESVRRFLRDWK